MTDEPRKILFIIGFPRSGTKLLRNVLNNHADIFIAGELLFLPYLLDNWERYGDLSQLDNFRIMHREVMNTFYFAVRANQGVELIGAEQWHSACESFDPTGVMLPLIKHETAAPDRECVWLGDKSPNYTTDVARIAAALPEARFIHIVRDVRDAALSARKIWNKNIYRFAQRWADGLRGLWQELDSVAADSYREIRYEDLLEQPSDTLQELCVYLGVEFNERMICLEQPAENFGDAKAAVGILTGNSQKYKTQLTAVEQSRIESICSDVLQHYGYDTSGTRHVRRVSRPHMLWYMLADIYNRVLFDLRLGRGFRFIAKSMTARSRTRL